MGDNPGAEIKTMKLYSHVERIYNELRESGFDDKSNLDVKEVCKFDQYHYFGVQAVDEAIQTLNINSCSRVLDVGSGLGGPSRHLAHSTGCRVTAMELQEDLNRTASDLTSRCQLGHLIQHTCADFLQIDTNDLGTYDYILSWLVFLHIPEKQKLFNQCAQCIKQGGKMYIEDYFMKSTFSSTEEESLKSAVYCSQLSTRQQYEQWLQQAGFKVQFDDVTETWSSYVHKRAQDYRADKGRHVRVQGQMVYDEQESFYSAVDKLFAGGHIGGAKIVAEKL